jgi:hypothetical protein
MVSKWRGGGEVANHKAMTQRTRMETEIEEEATEIGEE